MKSFLRRDYPLQKDNQGNYPTTFTRAGNLRCPLCSSSSWSIQSMLAVECNTCYAKFESYGLAGMRYIGKDQDKLPVISLRRLFSMDL